MAWYLYIPEDGAWELPYTGKNKREAEASARKMLKVKRLPTGSGVYNDSE